MKKEKTLKIINASIYFYVTDLLTQKLIEVLSYYLST